jgi:predicted phage terminase large subunit-like protein
MGFATQHQQRPTDPDGSLFKLHWFKTYRLNEAGDAYQFLGGSFVHVGDCVTFFVVDPATGKGPGGDFTAVGVFAVTPDGRVLLLDMLNARIPIENLAGEVRRLANQWRPEFAAVEANGFQIQVAREIRDKAGLTVREVHPNLGSGPQKSKLVRAQKAIVMAEAGDIWIPAGSEPWVDSYTDELAAFTGEEGGVDNQVDVTAYACHLVEQVAPGEAGEPFILSRRFRP